MTKKYRLGSSALVYAPGVIRWAINGAKFRADRDKMVQLVAGAWAVPVPAVRQLLSGAVPVKFDGDTVEFEA